MKKSFLLLSILTLSVAGASAQLSLQDQALLRAMRFEQNGRQGAQRLNRESKRVLALAKLADGTDAAEAKLSGATVTPLRGGFAVVSMDIDSVEA
ncbi:MAG: hypothetical protein K2M61_03260, partial [Muribaculaceae bacterium]|nr:hypothetical protein [Muribaculaceae bacterium]